jgi:hypothetical protein
MQRQAISEALESPEIPPIIAAWCAQLLSPEFLAMLRAFPAEQIDVRLSAAKGRVRPKPVVILNGGPSSLVEP